MLLAAALSITAMPAQAAVQTYLPSTWAAEKMALADEVGLISTSFTDLPFQAPINRLDFSRLLVKAWRINDNPLPELPAAHPFADTQDPAAERASLLGLVQGSGDGCFRPEQELSREMAAVMLANLGHLFGQNSGDAEGIIAEQLLRSNSRDSQQISPWAQSSFAWVYSQGILSGGGDGCLEPQGKITREQAVTIVLNLLVSSGCPELTEDGKPAYVLQTPRLQTAESSRHTSFSSRSVQRYDTAAAAAADMVTIQVSVWQLSDNGEKKAVAASLTVHRDVAGDVQAIFQEIFRGSEKFPIRVVSGYSFRSGTSQHSNGTAIDINPTENCFLGRDGAVKAGSFWLPGVNPYSIPAGGDVVRAFNQYGWKWSPDMNWSNGADYMHFSLTGN